MPGDGTAGCPAADTGESRFRRCRSGQNGSVADPKHERDLRRIARERFGYEDLLPGQEEAMRAVTEGADTLVVMPTGSGKSAIYQVPALLIDGPTLIVSPLIALQRDQVEGLRDDGSRDAALLNSTLPDAERESTLDAFAARDLEYLMVAPEQLADPQLVARLSEGKPSLFVVDEAHCISSWGHDFRPDYLRLAAVARELGRPPILALTATAAPIVRDEIVNALGMQDPCVIVQGFDRPNIHLSVQHFADEQVKVDALYEAAADADKPGIVYVATRREAEDLAGRLWTKGVQAVYYHGGMTRREREEAQEAFMNGSFEVVVATSAFGMGIDKPDVRFVFHAAPPDSLDSLYQEVGRAGRDGKPARAVLFYRSEDLGLRRFFVGGNGGRPELIESVVAAVSGKKVEVDALAEELDVTRRALTGAINLLTRLGAAELRTDGTVAVRDDISPGDAAELARRAEETRRRIEDTRIDMVRQYAETTTCRRRMILTYFGEDVHDNCGHCDNCDSGRSKASAPEPGRIPANTPVRHEVFGRGHVVRDEGERLVVLFEAHGYKTLAASLVRDQGLLDVTGAP